jgi:Double zinc ribbon
MHCQACGFENASGIKFCGECGGPLKLKCTSCGFENALGIKFCGECGQHLADAQGAAPLPRLRTYTPNRLAERILAEQAAMEARGAQDGEFGFLRCGTTEARILLEPRYPASGESPIHGAER